MKKRGVLAILLLVLFASCGKEKLGEQVEPEEERYEYVPGYDDDRSDRKGSAFDGTAIYVKEISHANPLVFALDLETEESYVLCSKPDCLHDSEECNAYTEGVYIAYGQDRLILSKSGKVVSLRLDGSGGEEIGKFGKEFDAVLGEVGVFGRPIMVHRGYVYLGYSAYLSNRSVLRLERLPVSGGEPEILWEESCQENLKDRSGQFQFYNYYGIGEGIYFVNTHGGKAHIYYYHTKTGEIAQIYEGEFDMDYLAEDGKWYLQKEDGVYCWDPKTGEERRLYVYSPSSNGGTGVRGYLYFYEDGFSMRKKGEGCVFVFYNGEGEEVAEVGLDVPNPERVYGIGHFGKYFVCTYLEKPIGVYGYAVLDTSRLGDPTLDWMRFSMPVLWKDQIPE